MKQVRYSVWELPKAIVQKTENVTQLISPEGYTVSIPNHFVKALLGDGWKLAN